ncbi:DUF3054 domain-containing protein [Cryobacterium melibiosiphilum]|uniref:DUF3054 domain-containing protein n=1 Tax=Cryobacterium melibiosiphilum TaxID=995039 RepID=A0A3A5MC98_9MICO|nr:DUF3054 domain-containing protein [Cryobacterium melibiosiphilum]RJT86233.1 DUF3054 domain-containing protein [Cryobacterium melibiosiphilum]
MTAPLPPLVRLPLLALLIDAALVVLFVLIGRASHNEGLLGTLVTLWPFLAGLVGGWLMIRAWRAPFSIAWTGLAVWAATVVLGLLLRVASGQGVQLSFMIVTTIVLGVFLLGWRGVVLLVGRARVRRAALLATAKRMSTAG